MPPKDSDNGSDAVPPPTKEADDAELDFQLAKNAHASLKNMNAAQREQFYKGFDFESLYIDGNTEAEAYKPERLKQFVDFKSSFFAPGAEVGNYTPHTFSDAELKELQLTDLTYKRTSSGGFLQFKLKYKGKTSSGVSTLAFDANEYYKHKISIDEAFIKQHYMRGMANNLLYFSGQFLKYDKDRYAAELVLREDNSAIVHHNNAENKLVFDLTFNLQKPNKELARLTMTVSGFKPLSSLQHDLVLKPTKKLLDDIRTRLKRKRNGATLIQKLTPVANWIRNVEFYVKVGSEQALLEWKHNISINGGTISVLEGGFGHREKNYGLDIYLENPQFQIRSAEVQGKNVLAKLEMTHLLDTTVGVTFDLLLTDVMP